MKYGDKLREKSIPIWETHNIDYNDIKQLIKIHTTDAKSRPTPIPGKENETNEYRSFDDELQEELYNQHQRIGLFVHCKAGEITRRLSHIEKKFARLQQRTDAPNSNPLRRLEQYARRVEKFSRLEEETLKAGDDVQSLPRFVGAQRLAFQKLLKKHKRWTGSSKMSERFQREVLNRPGSFSMRDFGPLLTQWNAVLATIRRHHPGLLGSTESIERTSGSAPSTVNGTTSSQYSGPLIHSSATSTSESRGDPPQDRFIDRRKQPPRRKYRARVKADNASPPPPPPRYWNEFDDGDEASSHESFTFFVDPNADSNFFAKVMPKVQAWGSKATSWLSGAPQPCVLAERQPLMGDDLERQTHHPQALRHYSTIQAPVKSTSRAPRRGDPALLPVFVAFFVASIIIILICYGLIIWIPQI